VRMGPVLEQLEGLGFVTLGGSEEFVSLTTRPGRLPAAFAVHDSEEAEPNRYATGVVGQRVSVDFSIVLIAPGNGRFIEGRGLTVSDEFTALRRAVIERLLGWQHPDLERPTEFKAGRLVSTDGTAITYALRFTSNYHLRKAV
jgi:hypothetical protein